jgi:four helix bundle protein
VFRESYEAALAISKQAKQFPPYEQFELGSQLRRAARSIPANIVEEWAKRYSTAEFKRYLQVAIGSCDEVKLWLETARDGGFIPKVKLTLHLERYKRIGAMLASLWKNWQKYPK